MHLRRTDGRRGQVGDHPQEPAQDLVHQPEGRHDQRRQRSDLRLGPTAAVVPVDPRRGLFAGLFLPCGRPRHALQADRHGPVQGRRLQAQRIDQAGAQSGLLEEGASVSRRHRLEDRAQPLNAHAGLRRRRVRHDVRQRRHLSIAEGREGTEARCRLRGAGDQRQFQHPDQSRLPAVQQSRASSRAGAGARHQGLQRHPGPGPRSRRRRHAAAAAGCVGHAQGDAGEPARPFARHREEPRRSTQDHGEAGLWPRQDAQSQGRDPQHRDLSRSGGDPDRPAEADLHRGRARADRHHGLVHQDPAQGLPARHEPDGPRHRRPRHEFLRELLFQVRSQLHGLQQSRGRQADRPAVGRAGQGKAQEDRVGDREEAGRRRGAAGDRLERRQHLLGRPR